MRKIGLLAITVVSLFATKFAYAQETLIEWSTSNTSALTGWIGQVWTDLYIPILLALGVSLGFIILRKIIGLTKGGAR